MDNSYIANEIKSRVKMPELLRCYGIEVDRKNRIACPLHSGTDKNCGVKDDYIHCFVCNESADQIGFVQKYFSLSFADAVSKINTDFSLGLPIGQRVERRKQIDIAKERFRRKQKAKEKEEAKDKLFSEIIDLNEECAKLNDFIKSFVVSPFDFNSAQIKAQAKAKLEYTKYTIEQKETELKDLEKRDSFDT
jgi:DNA primase